LLLKPAACARVEKLLPQRYVFLLIVLASAWCEDGLEPEALRGFRSAAEIGDRIAKISPRGRIRDTAAKAYVCETSALVRRAILPHASGVGGASAGVFALFDLFERRRKLGYRIGPCGLDVMLRPHGGSVS
jgi:hypothetical protein